MNITKTVLKRPVTTVMVVLCLIVFGLSSVLSSKLELTPSMDMPMLVVFTTHKHRLLTCLLSSVGALIGFGIISMIAGIIAGLNGAFDKIMEGGDASPEIIGRDIMSGILPVAVVTSIATVIVMVVLVRKIYKRFLHPVIAR